MTNITIFYGITLDTLRGFNNLLFFSSLDLISSLTLPVDQESREPGSEPIFQQVFWIIISVLVTVAYWVAKSEVSSSKDVFAAYSATESYFLLVALSTLIWLFQWQHIMNDVVHKTGLKVL